MGFVDIHSHILPGADDGSQSMEQSIQMLQKACKEGIAHIFATPHYKQGRFQAQAEEIQKRLLTLKEAAGKQGLEIGIYGGTEIYYRSGLEERLDRGSLLSLNKTEYLLTEFSPFEDYGYIRNAVDDLLGLGYIPILAHVERYHCFLQDLKKINEVKDMGARIQVNAGSIIGDYGFRTKKFCRNLLKKELADYLGTDAHDTQNRSPSVKKCAEFLYKNCGREYADEILFQNAQRDLL